MNEEVFTDKNGQVLIVRNRRSAVFFLGEVDVSKKNEYHKNYVSLPELFKLYEFSQDEFKRFFLHCESIGYVSWKSFNPREADSEASDYYEYYDREFDNNGYLDVKDLCLKVEGPYTQLKSNGNVVRLTKFNKRKFESFVYDLNKQNERKQIVND